MKKLERKINIVVSTHKFDIKMHDNFKEWELKDQLKKGKSLFICYSISPKILAEINIYNSLIKIIGENNNDSLNNEIAMKINNEEVINNEIYENIQMILDFLEKVEADLLIFMEKDSLFELYKISQDNKIREEYSSELLLINNIFLASAIDLKDPIKWWDLRRRICAYIWLEEQKFEKLSDIYDIWHTLKFLIQEIDRKKGDEIGKRLSKIKSFDFEEKLAIKEQIIEILFTSSNSEKIKNMLWKNYKHLSKKYKIKSDKILEPNKSRDMEHLAEEVLEMEKISDLKSIFFGSSPINILSK